jgi:amino acid transporter
MAFSRAGRAPFMTPNKWSCSVMSASPATSYGTIKPTRRAPSSRSLPEDDAFTEPLSSPSPDGLGTLHRGLSSRQVQMIAIAGTIGTGLFLGTGRSLAQGGPASMLICYFIVGFIVHVTLVLLGEMATQYPVAGEYLGVVTFLLPRSGPGVSVRFPSFFYQRIQVRQSHLNKWSLLHMVAFGNSGAHFGYMQLWVDIAYFPVLSG